MKMPFVRFIYLVLFITIVTLDLCAQNTSNKITGTVSYKSSTNIYVKFSSTEKIKPGDTIYFSNQAALVVKNLSSISAVCTSINNVQIEIGQSVVFTPKEILEKVKSDTIVQVQNPTTIIVSRQDSTAPDRTIKKSKTQYLNGRLSISMNGDIQEPIDSRYTGIRISNSLQIDRIAGKNFYFESYATYRHRYGIDLQNKDFFDETRIFSLAAAYQNERSSIWIGRRINYNLSNMGTSDGMQYEHTFKHFKLGTLLGFRPDLNNFGFNAKLPQWGVFLTDEKNLKHGPMQFSIALAQQLYETKVDRQFIYTQFTMNPTRDLNLFFSGELDYIKKVDTIIENPRIQLTSIYGNARYKFSKRFNMQITYDNRRNVIFFETYRNEIDRILDQQTRQGLRWQANYNPMRHISINLSSFIRFQGGFKNPTSNYMAFINFNQLGRTGVSFQTNFNYLQTEFIHGITYGGRVNRDFFNSYLSLELNGRLVRYQYANSEIVTKQTLVGTIANIRLNKLTFLMLNFEADLNAFDNTYRYYITGVQRFKSKNKR